MIPADHITSDGDMAWLVVAADPDEYGWAAALDRPCDTCGSTAPDAPFIQNCPDCINGRHTFEIEVSFGAMTRGFRTHRASVVPGMVLPIIADCRSDRIPAQACIEVVSASYIREWCWSDRWKRWQHRVVTLPPAAKPGMWAIQLKIAAERNKP